MNLLFLYLEFFKIGLFAVGGGLATLPFLFFMAADNFTFIQKTGWLGAEQVGNFIAIAQCSPGAIGVNIAVQTGFLYGSAIGGVAAGVAGGVLAALGLVSPAIIVIAAVAKVIQSLKENKHAVSVFSGLRPAAAGILCAAGWGAWRLAFYNSNAAVWHELVRWRDGLVCIVLFIFIVKFKIHPVICIVIGAAAGVILKL